MPTAVTTWDGCYEGGWHGLITPGSFAHPAKMSKALLERIVDYLFETGAVQKGDTILDCFGGVGSTAIIGASRGLQVVCVELEEKFCALARANVDLHRRDWEILGVPLPVIMQGDSRRLCQMLAEAQAIVASPPYTGDTEQDYTRAKALKWDRGTRAGMKNDRICSPDARYGETPGDLSALPTGEVGAVITSPPYTSNGLGHGGGSSTIPHDTQGTAQAMREGYGGTSGNLGELPDGPVDAVIGSPPYAGNDDRDNTKERRDQAAQGTGCFRGTYGETDGNLGQMVSGGVDAVISSPPYEEIAAGAGGLNTQPAKEGQQGGRSPDSASQSADQRYGTSDGQLARLPKGEVDAVVASPPYTEEVVHGRPSKMTEAIFEGRTARTGLGTYGDAEGQIGALPAGSVDAVVASPPFTQGYAGGGGINRDGYRKDLTSTNDMVGERTYQGTAAERTSGNLETLTLGAVEAVVTSPPYEDIERATHRPGLGARAARAGRTDDAMSYGTTAGNIGNVAGETFWSAALAVVRECHAVLKPGGTAVWIVKAFVRDKKIVDFPGDWRRLCEHVGFRTVLEAHAMLVEEEQRPQLFGDPILTRRERKSFFRRLAEKKGSPRIDWETVYVMTKGETP